LNGQRGAIVTIEAAIQSVSIMVAVTTFVIAHAISRARDRRVANRETYQRLELASIDLFRFEADHIEAIRPIWEVSVPIPPQGSAEHMVAMDYVCQMLNLFEMAIRLRKEKVVPPEVFGSWVIWYYNLANAPHFHTIWDQVMWDYTSDLRYIMNEGVVLAKTETQDGVRRRRFFRHVASGLKCPAIGQWLARVEAERSAFVKAPGDNVQLAAPITIEWGVGGTEVSALTEFIVDNIDPTYISHGELQDGRATDRGHWSPLLRGVLASELGAFARRTSSTDPGGRVAVGRLSGAVVSLMMIEVVRQADVGYAVLNDLVVDRGHRDAGIGSQSLAWLEQRLEEEGIGRLFLESGIENESAHRFFTSKGFIRCSIVMFKDLPRAAN
jgi:GNAT superfamily N-acetyltransferase